MTTSADMLASLRDHYSEPWITFSEVATTTGGSWPRRIDFFAMHPWPSKGLRSVAVEVKVSRSDFMRELEDPTKRQPWEGLVSETWFAVPCGLVQPDEVPEGWGLLERLSNGKLRRKVLPQQRQVESYPPGFVAELLRHAHRAEAETLILNGRPVRMEHVRRLAERFAQRSDERRRRGDELHRYKRAHANLKEQAKHHGPIIAAVRRLTGAWTAAQFEAWIERSVGDRVPVDPISRGAIEHARRILDQLLEAGAVKREIAEENEVDTGWLGES